MKKSFSSNILACMLCLVFVFAAFSSTSATGVSDTSFFVSEACAVKAGDTEIEGWKPGDMVSSDIEIAGDPSEAAVTLEAVIIRLVQVAMPFLMIACVAIIVFNAIANIFRPQENRVKMGDLVKNMFINFFWILFAWIIVEAIVFVVTNGEMILFNVLLGY